MWSNKKQRKNRLLLHQVLYHNPRKKSIIFNMVNITDYANFGVIYYVQNYRTIEMMWLATVTKRHKLPQSHSFAVQQSIAILFLATQQPDLCLFCVLYFT